MLPHRFGMCAAGIMGAGVLRTVSESFERNTVKNTVKQSLIRISLKQKETGGAEYEAWHIIFTAPRYAGGMGF